MGAWQEFGGQGLDSLSLLVYLMLENGLVYESVEPVGSCFFVWSKPSAGCKSGLCPGAHEADRFYVFSIDLLAQPGAVSMLDFFFVFGILKPEKERVVRPP